jgi:hypothetical protein
MNLLWVEMRRALHRRAVRVLIVIALAGCVLVGVIAFTSSSGRTLAELSREGGHPALMRTWWETGGDSALHIAFLFLIMGALFGGASVAGAEWRAGTVTTVLTWEPRRVRLQLARAGACGLLAAVIAFALQSVFLAALLPATVAHGSTAGTTSGWWVALVAAMARISLLTAIAAVIACSLATLARNTAFALVTVFAWSAVIEGIIRGLKPGLAGYLWGENLATAMSWAQLDDVEFQRGPLLALLTMVTYAGVIAGGATLSFARRDIAAST